MSKGLARLLFVMSADIKEFQTEIRKAEREMQKMGKNMQRVGKDISKYVSLPLIAAGGASVIAFRRMNESMKQVEAGIQSTGGAAGFTSGELRRMATDMGRLTATLNQDILGSVTAQLLTFTNIAGDSFEKAQMAALDMSARMGTDLRSSAMMVGRALNDPIRGITALSRAGVQFTDEQREMINVMQETGNVAGAQGIILEELQKQFGGSAAAAGDAFDHMKNAAIMLGQEFGELIHGAITPFIKRITSGINYIADLDDTKKRWIVTIGGVAAAIGPVITGLGFMIQNVLPKAMAGVRALTGAFRALRVAMMANPWAAVAAGIAAVGAGLIILNRRGDETTRMMRDLENAAAQSTAKQRVEMDQLIRVAQDQTRTDKDRIDALREINRLMPDHIDDLNLATINTDKASEAQEAYNKVLMEEARIIAAKEKLVEIERERIRLASEGLSNTQAGLSVGRALLQNFYKISDAQSQAVVSAEGYLNGLQKQNEELDKQEKMLLGIISGHEDISEITNAATGESGSQDPINNEGAEQSTGILKELNQELRELREELDKAQTIQEAANYADLIAAKEKDIEATRTQIEVQQMLNNVLAGGPAKMESVESKGIEREDKKLQHLEGTLKKLEIQTGRNREAMVDWQQIASGAAASIGMSMMDMAGDTEQSAGKMISQLLRQVVAQLISQIVSSVPFPANIALAAGAGGMAGMLFNQIPKMATGGIVPPGFPNDTYPAFLSSGEKVLPSPEPLNVSAESNVQVDVSVGGKLVGNDFLFFIERQQVSRERVTGS